MARVLTADPAARLRSGIGYRSVTATATATPTTPATPTPITHENLGAVRVQWTPTGDSADGQVQDTLALMGQYARQDSTDPGIQYLAGQLRTPERIWSWVKQSIRFRRDQEIIPRGPAGEPVVEVLIRPVDMVQAVRQSQSDPRITPVGDCDDYSMLVASLLLASGYEVYLEMAAVDPQYPGVLSHIYVVAKDPGTGQEIALDASHGPAAGWKVRRENTTRVERVRVGSGPGGGGLGLGLGGNKHMNVNTAGRTGRTVIVGGPGPGMGGVDDDINWAISQGAGSGAGSPGQSPWWGVLNNSLNITGRILTSRLGVPPAGTVITTPGGQVIRQADGWAVPAVAAGTNVAGGSVILLAAAGLAALLLLRGR